MRSRAIVSSFAVPFATAMLLSSIAAAQLTDNEMNELAAGDEVGADPPEDGASPVDRNPRLPARPTSPAAAFQMEMAGKLSIPTANELDSALVQRGYEPIGPQMGFVVGLSGQLANFELGFDFDFSGDIGEDGKDGVLDRSLTTLGGLVRVGYRLEGDRWSITPRVGIGSISTQLCATQSYGITDFDAGGFEQILSNPGLETCLSETSGVLRTGLALRYRVDLTNFDEQNYSGDLADFEFGLTPAYQVAFGSPSWEDGDDIFPPLDGPSPPLSGFMVLATLSMRVGGHLW